MSAQLGEQAGLGVAPDTLKLNAQTIMGCYMLSSRALPQFLPISKDVADSAVESGNNLTQTMPAKGKIKKFGIYIHTISGMTGDAEFIFRKNLADFGTSIIIPQATVAETIILSDNDLDLEFDELDEIHYALRMVSGAGTLRVHYSCEIEFESDSDGDFEADVQIHNHITPAILSTRRNIRQQGNWISVGANGACIPALYDGNFIAVAVNVPTGFTTTATHIGAARRHRGGAATDFMNQSFIVGETGTKIELRVSGGADDIDKDTDIFTLSNGQSPSGLIEPDNVTIVVRLIRE